MLHIQGSLSSYDVEPIWTPTIMHNIRPWDLCANRFIGKLWGTCEICSPSVEVWRWLSHTVSLKIPEVAMRCHQYSKTNSSTFDASCRFETLHQNKRTPDPCVKKQVSEQSRIANRAFIGRTLHWLVAVHPNSQGLACKIQMMQNISKHWTWLPLFIPFPSFSHNYK